MAGIIEGKARVTLDGQDAVQELKRLESKASELRTELIALSKEKIVDKKRVSLINKELRATNKSIREVNKSTFSYEQVLNDLSGASVRDLNKAMRKLRAETDQLNRKTKEYQEKSASMKKIQGELKRVRTEMRQTKKEADTLGKKIGRVADGFSRYSGLALGLIGTFTGLVFSARKAVDTFNEFEAAESNLSALTGLTGNRLKKLSKAARDMATATDDSGVRITKSAKDIEEAFAKVGSQRPELLKNSAALKDVTKDALILSEASKGDLASSTIAVTSALNNFNLDASESRRVINALAAGSKEGAADIPKLTKAFDKAGTTANLMGLSVEQLVGITEAVAPKFNDMSIAGNSLDKVLLKMKDQQIGFVDGAFNMNAALDEIRKRMEAGESASKMFGTEHAKMVEVLLAEQSEIDRYTKAVTGTNIAIEQATTNTSNNAAKLEQAKNKAKENAMVLGEQLAPAITFSTNAFSYLLKILVTLIKNWSAFKDYIVVGTVVIGTYTAAIYANTIATKAAALQQKFLAKGIKGVIKQTKLFNMISKLNPYALLASAIAAAGAAIYLYTKRAKSAYTAQKALNKISAQALDSIAAEKVELERLAATARNEKLSKKERLKAIKKLNDISPKYLGNLTLEKINTDEAKKAMDSYLSSLEKKAKLLAAQDELVEIEKQMLKINAVIDKLEAPIKKDSRLKLDDFTKVALEKSKQELEELKKTKQAVLDVLDETEASINSKTKKISNQIAAAGTGSAVSGNIKKQNSNKGTTQSNTPPANPDDVKAQAEKILDIISEYNFEMITDAQERDLKKLANWFEKEKERIELSKGTEEEKEEALLKLNDLYKEKRTEVENKYNQERLSKFQEVTDWLKQQEEKLITDTAAIRERDLKNIEEKYDKQIRIAEEARQKDLENEAKYIELINNLQAAKEKEKADYKNANAGIDLAAKFNLSNDTTFTSIDDELNERLTKLQEFYEQDLVSFEEYADTKTQVEDEAFNKQLGLLSNKTRSSLNFLNSVATLFKKAKQAEISQVETSEKKKLKAINDKEAKELKAAGDNEELKKKIRAEAAAARLEITSNAEEKKKNIQKKYADKQFAVTVAQIIAQTALAAMQAFAQLGPIAGAIAAGVIAATGIAQIAIAKEQRDQVKGLAKGGRMPVERKQDRKLYQAYYDDPYMRGYIDKPRVLVAEDEPEYVVPGAGLRNPVIGSFIGAVEEARVNGTLYSFDYDNVLKSIQPTQGFAEGGYTDTPPDKSTPAILNYSNLLLEIIDKIDDLVEITLKKNTNLRAHVLYEDIENARNKLHALKSKTTV